MLEIGIWTMKGSALVEIYADKLSVRVVLLFLTAVGLLFLSSTNNKH